MPEPTQYPPATLRLQPDSIPDLRVAIEVTLDELSPHLGRMEVEAHMPEPWLGDSESHKVWAVYDQGVMRAPDGAFQAIRAYERQLMDIRDRLVEIERAYSGTEDANRAGFEERL
ncbi:hypothetical protein ACVGOW_28660 [Pseudonocardia saturnea]